jgi:hypothetical protein
VVYKNLINNIALLVGVGMLLSIAAFAQNNTAMPAQASGASVGGVNVSLVEISTGKEMSTKTDGKGNFAFSNLGAGTYRLRIGCARLNADNDSGPVGGQGAGREKQQCFAEMSVQISENSSGSIAGIVQQTSPRQ